MANPLDHDGTTATVQPRAVAADLISDQGWSALTGPSLTQVSAGSTNDVWGIDASGNVYTLQAGGVFQLASGGGLLTEISVAADGSVWGVNTASDLVSNIFYWSGNGWTELGDGWLTQVTAGRDGTVWGVNATVTAPADDVFQWTGNRWDREPGYLTWISLGDDGTLWGVNANETGSDVYQWTGSGWSVQPLNLVQISVGSASYICGVDANGALYIRDPDLGTWAQSTFPGIATNASVASDGTLCVVDNAGTVWTTLLTLD